MIVYYTTIWTPYHESICRALAARLGNAFRLVLTRPIDDTRNLGWSLSPPHEPWIVQPPREFDDVEGGPWASLLESADVAIVGSLLERRSLFAALDRRIRSNRPTYFMSERLFKKKLSWIEYLKPYNWYLWLRLHNRYDNDNVHILAIGQGVEEDFGFLKVRKPSIHRWAYFPRLSDSPVMKKRGVRLRIAWCGRMIACKHVDHLIRAVAILSEQEKNRIFVTIAGEGPERAYCEELVKQLNLSSIISINSILPHDEMIGLLEQTDVYVFPSDREEGWGVALEEAMDCCCVPIASRQAGSAPFLIEDCFSGFTYEFGDINRIASCISLLLRDADLLDLMGGRARSAVQRLNVETGVEKLINILKIEGHYV